jgi:3-hydroxy-9,10-secoandrosta-1,3,5(10)-triene-9,17-dione monooxygenase
MIPQLAEGAARGEQERRISARTIGAMQEAGFFRVLQSKRWGGFEMHPSAFFDVQMTLAEGDVSTAWVYGNLAVLAGQLALFDDRAASDVWGSDASTLICCSMMRTGKASPCKGGFVLSGGWRYLSGCDHCVWALLGGVVEGTEPADARIFLVPRREIEILDTWRAAGLKATGSHDAVVRDAFVPEYRTHRFIDNFHCAGAGLAINTAPLYRIPFGQLFSRGTSAPAIGALQGILDAFLRHGAARVNIIGRRTAEDPEAQLVCAEAIAAIDEMKTILHRNFEHLMACAERGEMPSLLDRMRFRFQSAAVVERCSLLAARLFKAAGAAALLDDRPFGRFLSDINAARQHHGNQFELHGRSLGATMLGLTLENDSFL